MQFLNWLKLYQLVTVGVILILLTSLQSVGAQSLYNLPGAASGPISPVIAELDGNSADGKELAIASQDSKLSVLKSDGSELWSVNLPNSDCSFTSSPDRVYASPAVGNLFGNGVPYIVVGYGGFRGKPCDGGVAAYRASDGQLAWIFSVKAWAKSRKFDAFRNTVFSTPALSDVDGDGKLEIGFGSFDRNVYLLNSDGSVRWYYTAADTVFTSPSFVDVNGDGIQEMIIGTDISRNQVINPPTPNGGYLYALKTTSKLSRGARYNFRDPRLVTWLTAFDQVMQSSPAVGELLSSNPGPEIVIGAGCFFPQSSAQRTGRWFKIVSAKTGKILKTLPVTACSPSAPAIADLDGDGRNEVILTVNGASNKGGDGNGHVIAWSPEANQVLWDVVPRLGGASDQGVGDFSRGAVVADLDGNGSLEVMIGIRSGVAVLEGTSGRQLECSGSACDRSVLSAGFPVASTPTVADWNGDGKIDLIVAGGSGSRGRIAAWSGASLSFNPTPDLSHLAAPPGRFIKAV